MSRVNFGAKPNMYRHSGRRDRERLRRRERSDRRKDRPEKTETNRLRPGQQHLSRHGRQSRRRIRFRKSPEINTDDDMTANM